MDSLIKHRGYERTRATQLCKKLDSTDFLVMSNDEKSLYLKQDGKAIQYTPAFYQPTMTTEKTSLCNKKGQIVL